MITTVTRKLQFCAGHRVLNHESKCRNMHGHNYTVFITAKQWPPVNAQGLDAIGRVIDFSVLKDKVGAWIDEHWDHGFIVFDQDKDVLALLMSLPGQKRYTMSANPTAENMASHLLNHICPALLQGLGVKVTHVRIEETPNCSAEVSL